MTPKEYFANLQSRPRIAWALFVLSVLVAATGFLANVLSSAESVRSLKAPNEKPQQAADYQSPEKESKKAANRDDGGKQLVQVEAPGQQQSLAYSILSIHDRSTNKAVSSDHADKIARELRKGLTNQAGILLKNAASNQQIVEAIRESREPLSDPQTKIALGKRLGAKWGLEINYSIEENAEESKVGLDKPVWTSIPTATVEITKIDLETGIELWTAEGTSTGEKEFTPAPVSAVKAVIETSLQTAMKDFIKKNAPSLPKK